METELQTSTAPPLGQVKDHVGVAPGFCAGKAHILGHRIKVQHVAVWHERMGLSPAEIVCRHPALTLADVHAALAYYFDHRDEIDADIRESEEYARKLEASASIAL